MRGFETYSQDINKEISIPSKAVIVHMSNNNSPEGMVRVQIPGDESPRNEEFELAECMPRD